LAWKRVVVHFLGKALQEQGHEVRLIPPQYVKPFVKTNKNDYIDAEAIAEAAGRPTMRFLPIKSDDQLLPTVPGTIKSATLVQYHCFRSSLPTHDLAAFSHANCFASSPIRSYELGQAEIAKQLPTSLQ
jgi:hypothetical protein